MLHYISVTQVSTTGKAAARLVVLAGEYFTVLEYRFVHWALEEDVDSETLKHFDEGKDYPYYQVH